MRSYSAFIPRFWITGTGRRIVNEHGPDHVVVAIYLFTGPQSHMGGLYHCPVTWIADAVGLSAGRVSEILDDLERLDFIRYDRDAQVVWVISMLRWQLGSIKESDNRLRHIATHLRVLPDTRLTDDFCAHYGLKIEGASKGLTKGVPKGAYPTCPVRSCPPTPGDDPADEKSGGGL